MDEKVKIGLVEWGWHATHSIYPSFKLIDDTELVVICDLREGGFKNCRGNPGKC